MTITVVLAAYVPLERRVAQVRRALGVQHAVEVRAARLEPHVPAASGVPAGLARVPAGPDVLAVLVRVPAEPGVPAGLEPDVALDAVLPALRAAGAWLVACVRPRQACLDGFARGWSRCWMGVR